MNFGKLYLVPNQLGDFNDNYIIKSHISLINKISFSFLKMKSLEEHLLKIFLQKKNNLN